MTKLDEDAAEHGFTAEYFRKKYVLGNVIDEFFEEYTRALPEIKAPES